jgi:hypothetical protein
MTDRYRSLGLDDSSHPNVNCERHMVKALAARDRARLVRVFEEDRARIENRMVRSLESRGM